MTNIKLLLVLMFGYLSVFCEVDRQVSAEAASQVKKFEDLFIWKVSDELKLTQKEEVIVADVIKDTNRKKQQSNAELETYYKKINEVKSDSEKKAILSKIRSVHKAQMNIALEELDRLNKGIGIKRLGQYLEIKHIFLEKIKNIWSQRDKKEEKNLPPPKVIEEK